MRSNPGNGPAAPFRLRPTRRYVLGAAVIGVGGAVSLPAGAGLFFWSDTRPLLTDPDRTEFVYRDGWIVGVAR